MINQILVGVFSDSLHVQMAISTINSSVNPPDILYYGTFI